MSDHDASIQRKSPHYIANGIAFEGDQRVPVVWNEATEPEQTPIEPSETPSLFSVCFVGAADAEEIGARMVLMGYLAHVDGSDVLYGPKNLSDVGRLLGISKQSAHERLTRFRLKLQQMQGEF